MCKCVLVCLCRVRLQSRPLWKRDLGHKNGGLVIGRAGPHPWDLGERDHAPHSRPCAPVRNPPSPHSLPPRHLGSRCSDFGGKFKTQKGSRSD